MRKNKKTKQMKKYLCILLCLLLVLASAGCGRSGAGRAGESGEETELSGESSVEFSDENSIENSEGESAGEDTSDAQGKADPDKEEGEKESAADTEKPLTMAELLRTGEGIPDKEEAVDVPETVLWFNATYAPLTYSNGWNWRLPGGLKPTPGNVELEKSLLVGSWSVTDRESALETVDSLIRKGHRGKCRECMDTLEDMGILDLEEEEFLGELLEADLEESLGRYVIAYYMYNAGVEPEYITAWDLCRVNQLYGSYYLCGYMTYEEAMDASLENSVILQEMYGSWEELVDAYMLGYRFWQGDLVFDETSPTEERYRYYEMLDKMEDGPYTLDWNMDLEKSW